MRSPLGRVDAVGKRKDVFRIGIVVLKRNLDQTILSGTGDEDRALVKNLLVPVDVFDKRDDSAFIEEFTLAVVPLIDQCDLHPAIQKRQFS